MYNIPITLKYSNETDSDFQAIDIYYKTSYLMGLTLDFDQGVVSLLWHNSFISYDNQ